MELHPEDYEGCDFKPLLQRRLKNFQGPLYARHWSKDVTARGSGDAAPKDSRGPVYSDYGAGKLNEEEEICLASALSIADQEELERSNKKQEELELRRRGAKPCYICKRITLSGIKLSDPDCPHVACTLEHLQKLHDAWCDLKYGENGFLKMDEAWDALGKLGETSPKPARAHHSSANSDVGAPSLQLLEQGKRTEAEGLIFSQYMERGMQLERECTEAKQSFEAALRSRASGSNDPAPPPPPPPPTPPPPPPSSSPSVDEAQVEW